MEPLCQPPTKKTGLSGGSRRILKEKEKSVKGNKSILSFVQSSKNPGSTYSINYILYYIILLSRYYYYISKYYLLSS